MELKEQFEAAQQKVKTLTERPANDELLELYALYKQSTEGDNNTDEPGMFDIKEKFKWNQWSKKRGLNSDEAMKQYVALVDELLSKYGHSRVS